MNKIKIEMFQNAYSNFYSSCYHYCDVYKIDKKIEIKKLYLIEVRALTSPLTF